MSRTEMPSFARVLHQGTSSDLRSVCPYVTAPAWASMLSGVNPGKHGIFDMLVYDPKGVHPPNFSSCDVPFLWDYLSWAGKNVLIAGVPFIYPAPSVNGIFVTGRFVPKMSCYPSMVKDHFDLSGYEYGRYLPNLVRKEERALLVARIMKGLKSRIKASLAMVDSKKWDFVALIDSLPDDALHLAHRKKDLVDEVYRALDMWLGGILSRLTETDLLLIVSDHGFGEAYKVFYMNEWLRSRKYIRDPEAVRAKFRTIKGAIPVYRFIKLHARRRHLSKSPKTLHSAGGQKEEVVYSTSSGPDSKVTALGLSEVSWIRLNVDSTKRESLEASLLKDLESLRQAGFVQNIVRTSEMFRGRHAVEAPGEFVVEHPEGWSVDRSILTHGRLYKQLRIPAGVHTPNGVLILYGPPEKTLENSPNIVDVTPTIMNFMGLPVPDLIDGTAIEL